MAKNKIKVHDGGKVTEVDTVVLERGMYESEGFLKAFSKLMKHTGFKDRGILSSLITISKKFSEMVQETEMKRLEMLDKMMEKDDKGNPVFTDEKKTSHKLKDMKEWALFYKELKSEKVDFGVVKIHYGQIKGLDFSVEELLFLEPIVFMG